MQTSKEVINTEVLVIGGGGAATRAALEARKSGAAVIMVVKGIFGKCGATVYEVAEKAGFNAVDCCGDTEDSVETHFNDIIWAAQGMAEENLARIVAEEAPIVLKEMEDIGVKFEKINECHYVKLGCFASKPRTHVIKNHGIPIVRCLQKEINKTDIKILSNTMITGLLVDNGTCFGAVGVDWLGNIIQIISKSTILATGGAGQLYKYNLNPKDITGDGFILAYTAGAELINMEYIQYGTATVIPNYALVDKWIWSVYPDIYNRHGFRFLKLYMPEGIDIYDAIKGKIRHMPFSTCDSSMYIDIGIEKEIMANRGTQNKGIYLSLENIPDEKLESLPMWSFRYPWFLSKGIDLKSNPLEISHFAHAFNGGIRINEYAQSTVDSLYAVGEVAGGYCGADRLGGDMLAGCQIFGKRAGRNAAKKAAQKKYHDNKKVIHNEIERINKSIYEKKGPITPNELINKLQNTMQNNVLIIRTEESLRKAIVNIKEIGKNYESHMGFKEQNIFRSFELENMIELAKIITDSAMQRKESRGSHYREDYPKKNDKYNIPIIVKK